MASNQSNSPHFNITLKLDMYMNHIGMYVLL